MKKKILLFIFLASLLLTARQTFAASLLFSSSIPDGHVGLHQMFKIVVELDPEGQVINSLEAHISYPHDLLRLAAIEDGSSFLSMWLERAHEEDGVISLSGIAPRGFSGNISNLDVSKRSPGDVVTLTFDPIKVGTAVISASPSIALLNDGLGTEAPLMYGSAIISIGDYVNAVTIVSTDVTPPDFIYDEIHYDAALDGEYLFFAASDKDSGIDHYEIKMGDVWQTIQSPYLIKQNGGVYYIKAIDRVGNERIKEVRAPVSLSLFTNKIFWLVIILLILQVIFIGRHILIRKKRKSF